MQTIRNSKGFTLIELMIVVVIIGILAAIALPKFSGMSKSAKEAEADPILKEVYTLQQAYYTRFNTYANSTELAKHGYDSNLSNATTANDDGRFYWIDMVAPTGTAAGQTTFCAVAKLTTKGGENGLQTKTMNQQRVITPGTAQAGC
jgi:prepilin-type N-terminal cleavage/methylation domain-containing protein